MLNMVLLFIGTTEIIVIGGIALLIFGGKKLPELMRGLGKGVKEFKDGLNKDDSDANSEHDTKDVKREEEKTEEESK